MSKPFLSEAGAQQAYDLHFVGVSEMIQRKKANEKFSVQNMGQHPQRGGFWSLSKCLNSSGNNGWCSYSSVVKTKYVMQKTEVHAKREEVTLYLHFREESKALLISWKDLGLCTAENLSLEVSYKHIQGWNLKLLANLNGAQHDDLQFRLIFRFNHGWNGAHES